MNPFPRVNDPIGHRLDTWEVGLGIRPLCDLTITPTGGGTSVDLAGFEPAASSVRLDEQVGAKGKKAVYYV